MSKDLFMMMREEEVATSNFLPTKKELSKSAKEFAENLVENGEHNVVEIYSQAIRLKEALTVVESVLKENIPQENFEAFGLKATYRSGGDTINYIEDATYADLKKKLDDRTELIKIALKTDTEFYDSEGLLVSKVSTTPRKSSLAISF